MLSLRDSPDWSSYLIHSNDRNESLCRAGVLLRMTAFGPRSEVASFESAFTDVISSFRDRNIMRSFSNRRPGIWLTACTLLLLSGCGGGSGKKVNLEGKIVKDGQPYKPSAGESLSIAFKGTDADGKPSTFGGAITPEGTFVANNIPPGKYKVQINLTSGGTTPAELAKSEKLNKQFEAVNSKLEYEVTSDATQKLDVDVGKGTVAKQ